ncbi:MAG: YtxH domain-containing protein [Holophaga sp.]|nr:YtxH domain-containing protein [Holophaga sp.]
MSEDRGALGTNMLMFLLGAAAGAVVVALVTPKSGPELRADVKDLAVRLKRKAEAAGKALCPECGQETEPGSGEAEG